MIRRGFRRGANVTGRKVMLNLISPENPPAGAALVTESPPNPPGN